MASVVKRGNSVSVVYYYKDENGDQQQKWETIKANELPSPAELNGKVGKKKQKTAAKKAIANDRKVEIEHSKNEGTFIIPKDTTVSAFMKDFVMLYGEKKWGVNTYRANTGLIENYINPFIGDEKVQAITTYSIDKYYKILADTKPIDTYFKKARTEYLTPSNIRKIHELLHCSFGQAVRWNLIKINPFDNAIAERPKSKERAAWTVDLIVKAMDACLDALLYIAMNVAFACSSRAGEILGLQWSRLHISDADIVNDNSRMDIDRELVRVSLKAMKKLKDKDILFKFPPTMDVPNRSTILVLKKPKTEKSIRTVWIPKTLAYILREWKVAQDKQKEFLGDEYRDYDLVLAQSNGRPWELKLLEKAFNKLKKEAGMPNVVFHSLRTSSTTYKLKMTKGDIKAVQGDTGHAQAKMVTEVYSRILDEDRKVNAQRFDAMFYANPDLRNVKAPPDPTPSIDLASLISQLQQSPELAKALAQIISAGQPNSAS
jgi:integrase